MVVGQRSCSTGAALKSEDPTFCSTHAASEIGDANMATIYLADGAPLLKHVKIFYFYDHLTNHSNAI